MWYEDGICDRDGMIKRGRPRAGIYKDANVNEKTTKSVGESQTSGLPALSANQCVSGQIRLSFRTNTPQQRSQARAPALATAMSD